ncbi:hypothetical protein VTK56DRAFT_1363 [Thermocarpiscus australiensis]
MRRPVQLRRLRIAAEVSADDGAGWWSDCIDALRRCRRPLVDVPEPEPAPAATAAALPLDGVDGLGGPEPTTAPLPLAARVLRGETLVGYWRCRAPEEGARGFGRRWWLSARVSRWLASLCRTAEVAARGWCICIIRPLVAKLLASSVPGGAGYSKLCWCWGWMARLSVAFRAFAA